MKAPKSLFHPTAVKLFKVRWTSKTCPLINNTTNVQGRFDESDPIETKPHKHRNDGYIDLDRLGWVIKQNFKRPHTAFWPVLLLLRNGLIRWSPSASSKATGALLSVVTGRWTLINSMCIVRYSIRCWVLAPPYRVGIVHMANFWGQREAVLMLKSISCGISLFEGAPIDQ